MLLTLSIIMSFDFQNMSFDFISITIWGIAWGMTDTARQQQHSRRCDLSLLTRMVPFNPLHRSIFFRMYVCMYFPCKNFLGSNLLAFLFERGWSNPFSSGYFQQSSFFISFHIIYILFFRFSKWIMFKIRAYFILGQFEVLVKWKITLLMEWDMRMQMVWCCC